MPGQLVVKSKPTAKARMIASLSNLEGTVTEPLLFPDYTLVTFPKDKNILEFATKLRQDPNVELAEPNYYLYADFIPNDPGYGAQWHFPQIQMSQAWDLSSGEGVTVAIVDSGVAYENSGGYSRAPDLAGTTFVPGWDFVNNDSHPNDDDGHGTHVAGTIAQSTNNGLGVAGIAFRAKIMPVKVLDSTGSGTTSQVAAGIKWAADNGAQVMNLSLGSPDYSGMLEDAVNYAYNKGVVVVAAAGNAGASSVGYPAAYDNVISVGATRYDQSRAYYSNYGLALDLVAPGGDWRVDQNGDGYADGVLQQTFCNPNWDPGGCSSTMPSQFGYYFFQGTSMAAPHVSGVAALLISQGAATTPDQVRRALKSTAKDLGAVRWDQFYGCGLVQAYDALRYTSSVMAPSSSPSPMSTTRPTAVEPSGVSVYKPQSVFTVFLPIVAREKPIKMDCGTGPLPTPTPAPSPTPTAPVTIASEDFEGAFPGSWVVDDGDGATNGEFYWGKRNCRPYAGGYSGWGVGAGANGASLTCGANYPDNARSWMIYGPFSLEGATAGDISFKRWVNNEPGVDKLGVYASVDGGSFYGGFYSGNSGDWRDSSLDLTNVYNLGNLMGKPQVWVALVFSSSSSTNSAEGGYVDNIVVRKFVSASGASISSRGDLFSEVGDGEFVGQESLSYDGVSFR
ncbi:MAG: S8 family peptidase [Chloroflexi bacterium]|nr:S8 family peptidase [Chloroflexota bacterium]